MPTTQQVPASGHLANIFVHNHTTRQVPASKPLLQQCSLSTPAQHGKCLQASHCFSNVRCPHPHNTASACKQATASAMFAVHTRTTRQVPASKPLLQQCSLSTPAQHGKCLQASHCFSNVRCPHPHNTASACKQATASAMFAVHTRTTRQVPASKPLLQQCSLSTPAQHGKCLQASHCFSNVRCPHPHNTASACKQATASAMFAVHTRTTRQVPASKPLLQQCSLSTPAQHGKCLQASHCFSNVHCPHPHNMASVS